MTQRDQVLEILRQNLGGVCGTYFYEEHLPRYAARLHELRSAGYSIVSRRCRERHATPQTEFVLIGEPERAGQVRMVVG